MTRVKAERGAAEMSRLTPLPGFSCKAVCIELSSGALSQPTSKMCSKKHELRTLTWQPYLTVHKGQGGLAAAGTNVSKLINSG